MLMTIRIEKLTNTDILEVFDSIIYNRFFSFVSATMPIDGTLSYSENCAKILLGGGSVRIKDNESGTEYLIDYSKFKRGYTKYINKYPRLAASLFDESVDMFTYLGIIQCVTIGEVTF